MIQVPITLKMQPMTWTRWASMGFVMLIFPAGLLLYAPKSWVFLIFLIPVYVFVFFQVKQQLGAIRLTLEPTGFRYTRLNYEIAVTWPDVRTVSRRLRFGKLGALAIVTTEGKYLMLGGFERMPEIADFIESRVKSSAPDTITALRLNQNTAWLFLAMLIGGAWMQSQYHETDGLGMHDLGVLLTVAGGGGILWMMPRNLNVRQANPTRRFFITLGIWIAIVIVVLLVLNFMMPKPH